MLSLRFNSSKYSTYIILSDTNRLLRQLAIPDISERHRLLGCVQLTC